MEKETTYKKISDGIYEKTEVMTIVSKIALSDIDVQIDQIQSGVDNQNINIYELEELKKYLESL